MKKACRLDFDDEFKAGSGMEVPEMKRKVHVCKSGGREHVRQNVVGNEWGVQECLFWV